MSISSCPPPAPPALPPVSASQAVPSPLIRSRPVPPSLQSALALRTNSLPAHTFPLPSLPQLPLSHPAPASLQAHRINSLAPHTFPLSPPLRFASYKGFLPQGTAALNELNLRRMNLVFRAFLAVRVSESRPHHDLIASLPSMVAPLNYINVSDYAVSYLDLSEYSTPEAFQGHLVALPHLSHPVPVSLASLSPPVSGSLPPPAPAALSLHSPSVPIALPPQSPPPAPSALSPLVSVALPPQAPPDLPPHSPQVHFGLPTQSPPDVILPMSLSLSLAPSPSPSYLFDSSMPLDDIARPTLLIGDPSLSLIRIPPLASLIRHGVKLARDLWELCWRSDKPSFKAWNVWLAP